MLSLCRNFKLCVALGFTAIGFIGLDSTLQAQDLFDHRATSGNEVKIMLANNGIFGLDISNLRAGGLWPASAEKPGIYLFGSGIWFGALVEGEDGPERRVNISYNPNSGNSWFVPGDVSDGARINSSPEAVSKYRLYFSTDYDAAGQALDGAAPGWPLWNGDGQNGPFNGNLGRYVGDVSERSVESQNSQPAFVSDQDVVWRYKDTDRFRHEGGADNARPMGLQVEQAVYSWNDTERENFVLVRYDLTNTSDEVLRECHFAFAGDYDIGDTRAQAKDDRMQYFEDAATRPMVALWSDGGNEDAGYGYFGVAMMQSPAVDEANFLRTDVAPADFQSQIGLTTVRNWVIFNDPTGHEERYSFMSNQILDGDFGANDGRLLFGSGPFNLRPGETARYVVGYFFAPSVGEKPDGSESDIANLVEEVNKGTQTWTNVVVSVDDQPAPAPFTVQLSPNPVNDILHIRAEAIPGVATAQITHVQIDIIDQASRVLLTQTVNIDPLAGLQQELDLAALNAGSYFCRMQYGEFTQSESFVLIR